MPTCAQGQLTAKQWSMDQQLANGARVCVGSHKWVRKERGDIQIVIEGLIIKYTFGWNREKGFRWRVLAASV